MTEKVVSLSGGLVLGMVFALFLGIGANQTLSSSVHMDYPSMSDLIGVNDTQSYRSSSPSTRDNDSTPSVPVVQPSPEQDRGRIIRIATVTETAEPVLQPTVSSPMQDFSKNSIAAVTSPGESSLHQVHRQHVSTGFAARTGSDFATVGPIARQSGNFTAIADGGQTSGSNQTSGDSSQPPAVGSKPQTSGSPTLAQNDPDGEEEGEEESGDPAIACDPAPKPHGPNLHDTPELRLNIVSHSPENNTEEAGDHHGHHPQGPSQFQNSHRPETD